MLKDNDSRGLAVFALLAGLFNLFLLVKIFIIELSGHKWEHIYGWLYAQYFVSYTDEFVKRGVVGTLFDISGGVPTGRSILLVSFIASNLFFVLFFAFSKKQMTPRAERAFLPFMLLFIGSPAVAMHLGFDAGRFDHINLVLTMTALIALVQGGPKTAYALVPLMLAAGLLVHEAFLFINAPLVLAVSYNEIRKGRYSTGLLIGEVLAIAVTLSCLLAWGKASPETLQRVTGHIASSMPGYDTVYPLTVWTNSLQDSAVLALSRYANWNISIHILFALPFLAANYLVYRSMLNPSSLDRSRKLVYCSPLALLPLFVLGVDFFRWIALCVIVMFMAFAYLAGEIDDAALRTPRPRDRVLLTFIALHTFLGPLGVNLKSFPFAGLY